MVLKICQRILIYLLLFFAIYIPGWFFVARNIQENLLTSIANDPMISVAKIHSINFPFTPAVVLLNFSAGIKEQQISISRIRVTPRNIFSNVIILTFDDITIGKQASAISCQDISAKILIHFSDFFFKNKENKLLKISYNNPDVKCYIENNQTTPFSSEFEMIFDDKININLGYTNPEIKFDMGFLLACDNISCLIDINNASFEKASEYNIQVKGSVSLALEKLLTQEPNPLLYSSLDFTIQNYPILTQDILNIFGHNLYSLSRENNRLAQIILHYIESLDEMLKSQPHLFSKISNELRFGIEFKDGNTSFKSKIR